MWWHQPVACVHVSSCDILVILVIMVSPHLLRSISQWMLTVKVETKCLANLNTCVLRGLVYCCEVWKQSIKNCGSYKVFTDFHIWLTRSLSLSLSPLFLHFLSRASSSVMFAAFISSSIRSIQCFFFSSLRTTGVARYSCWSVCFYQHTKFEQDILKMWLLHF